jgi:hypothetical protein
VEGSSVWSQKEMPTILKNIFVNIEGTIISTGAVDRSYGNLITWSVFQHAIWTSFSRISGAKSFSICDNLAIVNWCGNISSQRLAITGVITILNAISKLSWTTWRILDFTATHCCITYVDSVGFWKNFSSYVEMLHNTVTPSHTAGVKLPRRAKIEGLFENNKE